MSTEPAAVSVPPAHSVLLVLFRYPRLKLSAIVQDVFSLFLANHTVKKSIVLLVKVAFCKIRSVENACCEPSVFDE